MADRPRRKLSELEFIYSEHPNLRDVFVEGSFDESVINWFLGEHDLERVNVYPIETVEIPDGEVRNQGIDAGNRGRVAFLAGHLGERYNNQITCIIDSDFARLRNDPDPNPPLYETDFACMEMYFFCEENFNKFFTLVCRRCDWHCTQMMNTLAIVLQELFLCRYANHELRWNMDWLDRIVCTELNNWKIAFDSDDYVRRLLNKNSRIGEMVRFNEKVDELRNTLTSDARNQMNGHDMMHLLAWYLRELGVSRRLAHPDAVRDAIVLAIDTGSLRRHRLFGDLLKQLA